jgi:hypothetical protein
MVYTKILVSSDKVHIENALNRDLITQ